MSSGLWFALTCPKKEYEIKTVKEQKINSKSSSKQSLDQESERGSDKGLIQKDTTEIRGKDNLVECRDSVTCSESPASLVYFVEKSGPMEDTLKELLEILGIVDAVWTSERNDRYHQIYFPCDSGERCDAIMHALSTRGFGIYGGSTLAVLPCAVFYKDQPVSEDEVDNFYTESELETDDTLNQPAGKKTDLKKSMKGFKSMQQQFLKSVTARLTVAQVVESVRAGTQLTFDYIMFVMLASMIAAFGLMENSSVVIVASMLISPLMGPILAGTFGAVIRDQTLLSLGLKAEIIGLFLCNFIGFIIGLICGNFSLTYSPIPFPTPEMSGRGQDRSLWVGVLIALPSGAGVALSVLGGNAGSLVGVAISASLLPPAVNAGLLWGLAAVKHIQSYKSASDWRVIEGKDIMMNLALEPPKDYTPAYRYNMDEECAILGVVSLLLTIVNIICIILAAMLVLKIKEVAPKTSISTTNRFWKQDIKIARDYNKTLNNQEAREMGQNFLSEWAKLNGMNPGEVLNNTKQGHLTQYQTLQDMLQDVEDDDVYQTVMQYVPGNHPRVMSFFDCNMQDNV